MVTFVFSLTDPFALLRKLTCNKTKLNKQRVDLNAKVDNLFCSCLSELNSEQICFFNKSVNQMFFEAKLNNQVMRVIRTNIAKASRKSIFVKVEIRVFPFLGFASQLCLLFSLNHKHVQKPQRIINRDVSLFLSVSRLEIFCSRGRILMTILVVSAQQSTKYPRIIVIYKPRTSEMEHS